MIANSGEYRKKNGQRGYVMMNNFIFENKTKVYFGKGGVKEYLGGLLANFGETVMLAYGGGSIKCNGVYDEIMGILNAQGKCVVEFSGIMSTPTYAKVQDGAKLARENHVDLILAVGGGSVSDCCKVISGAFDTLSHAMETYFGKPDENNLSDDINEAAMRSVIRNIRILLTDPENYDARSELAWASAMAENGVLKIGKVTDFQAHQIEHQLGAYTNCNHGAGLAVIHPVLYRHIYKSGAARFARFAQNVWASHPRAVTGKPPPVSTRWPRSLRKLVCDQLCRAWHSRRHRLPRRGGFYQHHRWLLQKVDARRDLRNFAGMPVSIRAFRSKTKHSLRCAPFLAFLPLAFGPKRDIMGQTNCGKGR